MAFEEALAGWLPTQRWFAGKGSPITGVAIASDTTLAEGDPGLRHLVLTVWQGALSNTYQVFAGCRSEVPPRLRHAVIGPDGHGMTAYDGLHDADLTRLLLAWMAAGQDIGPLHFAHEPGAELDTSLESLVLTGEQSNTSLVFGEAAILKVFRRPCPGPNADLEVPRALARLGSPHVAAPLGWIGGDLAGSPAVFGILATYLRAAVDGWSLAATSVRDLYAMENTKASEAGGDFAGEATRLGEATAEVHRDLAAAFGVRELGKQDMEALATAMQDRLSQALVTVPQLAPYAHMLRRVFAEVALLDGPVPTQWVHGDYHLGQVMRTQSGWVLLDFEGEPAADPEHRGAWAPALRDVAGMLRSFDYAARYQLPTDEASEHLHRTARDWAHRNQAAFCAGYALAGGADPAKHAVLLRALTLDKAVYEVRYEALHRPSWLFIPLGSIADAEVIGARAFG
ncbi:MAG TPA: phosphotransferase [Streptosporangiaceae bacterium]|nr:phosphotransferase [Streptosporangiaceae bacterium]